MPKRTDISKILIVIAVLWGGVESKSQVAPKDFKYEPRSSPCSKIRLVDETGQPVRDQQLMLKKVAIYWSYYGDQKAFEAKPGRVDLKVTTNGNGEIDLSAAKKQPYFLEVKGKPSAQKEISLGESTSPDCSTEFVLNEVSKGQWLLDTKEELRRRNNLVNLLKQAVQQRKH